MIDTHESYERKAQFEKQIQCQKGKMDQSNANNEHLTIIYGNDHQPKHPNLKDNHYHTYQLYTLHYKDIETKMSDLIDPSLKNGYTQLFQYERFAVISSQLTSFEDVLMIRIFKSNNSYKLELTSQNNINFFYQTEINSRNIASISHDNGVNISLSNFANWINSIFQNKQLNIGFELTSSIDANLKVSKTEMFKFYEIINLGFSLAAEDELKASLTYRYQKMKIRKSLLENYLSETMAIIKVKNPTLYMNLQHSKKRKQVFK